MQPPTYPQPLVTVDIVLLTLKDRVLQVALHRREKAPYEGTWTLPGGAVHAQTDTNAIDSAVRILATKTGLKSPYFEQLETFADAYRDARGWSLSIAHYALAPEEAVGRLSENVRWVPVDSLPSLPFDHLSIVHKAVARLRAKAQYSSLPLHLLPAEFPLSYVQRVYEDVMGSSFKPRSFRRWLEELQILEEVPGKKRAEGGRPAALFRIAPAYAKTLAVSKKGLG